LPLCQIDLAQTISEWKDVQSNKDDDQYLGDVCFSLRYVPTSGKLTVGILECKRLKKMDITGASGKLQITAWTAKSGDFELADSYGQFRCFR
jgi:hypothetical protein